MRQNFSEKCFKKIHPYAINLIKNVIFSNLFWSIQASHLKEKSKIKNSQTKFMNIHIYLEIDIDLIKSGLSKNLLSKKQIKG